MTCTMNQSTYQLLVIFALFAGLDFSTSHEHTINKERESDGAFSNKIHSHFKDGHHDTSFDHESILGSVKEAEEYDSLPPEEAKKRLGALVRKMDEDGDGFVDEKELKKWIMKSFESLKQEETEERLEDIDTDLDGRVSWEEYVLDTFGINGSSEQQLDADDYEMLREDKVIFIAADKNKDNHLDQDEYKIFLHPEDYPDTIPLIVEQAIRDRDQNLDGVIDFHEYLGDSGNRDEEDLLSERLTFEQEYDKDNDGVLNSKEIKHWVIPQHEDIADEEVLHLIKECDDDSDDRLSVDEIVRHYETFVGSEATDFGDQLHHFEDEL